MSDSNFIRNFFVQDVVRRINVRRINSKPSRDKYVVIKHNGRQTRYCINKYGELIEQKHDG